MARIEQNQCYTFPYLYYGQLYLQLIFMQANQPLLLCFLLVLLGLVGSGCAQATSYSFSYPAHVYRIQSYATGVINGYISWQGDGAVLSICLLQGGMALNIRNCLQTFERTSGNYFIFTYTAPATDVYFIRVNLVTMGNNNYIKYTLRYTSSSPFAEYQRVAGIKAGQANLNTVPAQNEFDSSYSVQVSTANSVGSDPVGSQFSRYAGVRVGADTQFKSSFTSPSSIISNLVSLNNQTKCLVDVTGEAGQWLLALDIETAGVGSLIFDIIDLAVSLSTNQSCVNGNVSKSNVGVIVGSVIGGLVLLICCICVCKKCCCSSESNYYS